MITNHIQTDHKQHL